MNNIFTLATGLVCGVLTMPIAADIKHGSAPVSSHGPISVMGDHLHERGEIMTSYRYMTMEMNGSRIGEKRISAREIVGTMDRPGQFLVAPTNMSMNMHMFGVMYGLTDSVTLMGMTSVVRLSMDHLIRNGQTFTTESSGLGDTSVAALIRMFDIGAHKAHWGIGVSLPTGATDKRDDTPAMENAFLPYPMQLGSGTYDFKPSATYTGYTQNLSWGLQASALIRSGEGDEGYTLGDRISVSSWLAKEVNSNLSVSVRINYQDTDDIDGSNPVLNPEMIQTADPALHAGTRLDAALGVNYLFKNGHRIAVEYAMPVEQELIGPQLEVDSLLTLGWQKAF